MKNNANPEAINKDKQQPLDMAPPKDAEIIRKLLNIERKTPPKSEGIYSFLDILLFRRCRKSDSLDDEQDMEMNTSIA